MKRDFTVWYNQTERLYVVIEAESTEDAEAQVSAMIENGDDPEGDYFGPTTREVIEAAPSGEEDE